MSKVVLSKRLQTIADMVTKGYRICDIGCDHAYIAMYLIQEGIAPQAIAMDIHARPLERARVHIAAQGLSDRIETRLSDGFAALNEGEADTVIMTGMGGRLMQAIIADALLKTMGLKEMILGPQSEIPAFRRFLRMHGFRTEREELVLEEDKYYPIIKVAPGLVDNNETEATIIADCYGHIPLKERNPVLLMYLKREQKVTLDIISQLNNSSYLNKKNEKKLKEMRGKAEELADLIKIW